MNLPFFVMFLGSCVLLWLARTLSVRREQLRAFLQHPMYRLETFDEVVFGVPHWRLPEATSWVLLAVACLLFGGIGAMGLGLGLVVLLRTAPAMVLPAMFYGYAAWQGWHGLNFQVGRVPVVRRLRLSQPHLVIDDVALGLEFDPEELETAPAQGTARIIPWADVTRIDLDEVGSLVIGVRGEPDAVFGPLASQVGEELAGRIERRRSLESTSEAEVIDLARARLRALTERADRSGPDDD